MALVRLDVRFDDLDTLVEHVNPSHVVVVVRDADPIITLGSLHGQVTEPLGVWLQVSEDYSAQLAARDVATLSWLVPLDTVVVSAPNAPASAQVVEALLTNDEVNFANEVASIVAAYNRPAPPRPVAVWSFDGATLRYGNEILREVASETRGATVETTFG